LGESLLERSSDLLEVLFFLPALFFPELLPVEIIVVFQSGGVVGVAIGIAGVVDYCCCSC